MNTPTIVVCAWCHRQRVNGVFVSDTYDRRLSERYISHTICARCDREYLGGNDPDEMENDHE